MRGFGPFKSVQEFVADGSRCPQQGCICHESLICGGLRTAAGCRAWWRVSDCSSNRTAEHWTTGLAAKPLVLINDVEEPVVSEKDVPRSHTSVGK